MLLFVLGHGQSAKVYRRTAAEFVEKAMGPYELRANDPVFQHLAGGLSHRFLDTVGCVQMHSNRHAFGREDGSCKSAISFTLEGDGWDDVNAGVMELEPPELADDNNMRHFERNVLVIAPGSDPAPAERRRQRMRAEAEEADEEDEKVAGLAVTGTSTRKKGMRPSAQGAREARAPYPGSASASSSKSAAVAAAKEKQKSKLLPRDKCCLNWLNCGEPGTSCHEMTYDAH